MNNITYFDSYYMLDKGGKNYMKEIMEGKYIGGNTAFIIRDTAFNDLFASAENINWWHENVGPDFKLAFIVKPKKK